MNIARRRTSSPSISLVSTSDVAFLLLIFFLSTAALNVERGLLLDLPRAGEPLTLLAPERVATLDVAADRSVRLDGVAVPVERIRTALAGRLERTPGLVVRLRVAATAPYATFVAVLDQVKLAGARSLSLETGGPA
ncbi:MAG TPA: biopolymer transporter ExbD [Candidatus Eisenbacteria bacterium]|jgi:biopolymer transport protein ExbD|nr:biopolymer transporter ExbD [Candidatus Eisenbacteria bacterium]